MVTLFKKKFNSLRDKKRNRVVRQLPSSHLRERVIVGKRKKQENSKPNYFFIKIITWFLILAFFAATAYVFLFSHLLTVNAIDVFGTENLTEKSIAETITLDMEGKTKEFFNRDNLLIADAAGIEADLMHKYKLIRAVKVTKKFPNKLIVNLQERKSMLVYCTSGDCFVIDEEGKAYARADFENGTLGEAGLVVLSDDSGKKIDMSDFSMDLGFMQFVLGVKSGLDDDGIPVNANFSTPTIVSGDLHAETKDGWEIYFNQSLGAKSGIEMLKTVLRDSIDESKIKDLDYIDVRLADKVFYKFKNNGGGENNDDNSLITVEGGADNTIKDAAAGTSAKKGDKSRKK